MPHHIILLHVLRPALSTPDSLPCPINEPTLYLQRRLKVTSLALEAIHLALQIRVQGGIDMDQKDRQDLIRISEAAD